MLRKSPPSTACEGRGTGLEKCGGVTGPNLSMRDLERPYFAASLRLATNTANAAEPSKRNGHSAGSGTGVVGGVGGTTDGGKKKAEAPAA
jgi:hypothetical protein